MQKKSRGQSRLFYFADTMQSAFLLLLYSKHPVKHKKKKQMNQSMKHSNTGTEQVAKPSTLKELAAMYNVSTKTIRTWLLPHQISIGQKTGRYYTSLQVRIIFDKLGTP